MSDQSSRSALFDIRREERPLAALMSAYFFLVITSFWILKPLKKTLFIVYYQETGFDLLSWHFNAPQAELLAKVLNMFVAYLAVITFSALSSRLRRQRLTIAFTSFFMACYLVLSTLIDQPSASTVWIFYLFGDLFSTIMVATFFSFLNDSVNPDSARRLYGVVGLGGVLGGVFGTTSLSALLDTLSYAQWLFVTFGLGVLILLIASAAGRRVDRDDDKPRADSPDVSAPSPRDNPAIAGARLVFRSRYLLSIVAIVGIYEIVSTIVDFQFTSAIYHFLSGDEIGRQFSRVYAISNIVSFLVQLLLTSFVMRRFGLAVALLVLPVAIFSSSMAFFAMPILLFGSILNTADSGFSYSLNQSAKEALYVPTSRDEKYKAKAFIDMFVQRFAKAIAVGVSLLVTSLVGDFSGVRWLSALTIPLVIAWAFAARSAGRQFEQFSKGEESSS